MAKAATKVTFIRLTLDYYRAASTLAKEESRSVANMLTALVKEAIDSRKKSG